MPNGRRPGARPIRNIAQAEGPLVKFFSAFVSFDRYQRGAVEAAGREVWRDDAIEARVDFPGTEDAARELGRAGGGADAGRLRLSSARRGTAASTPADARRDIETTGAAAGGVDRWAEDTINRSGDPNLDAGAPPDFREIEREATRNRQNLDRERRDPPREAPIEI